MTIDASLAATLSAVGNVMKAAHDPWWIIASAAVALHGANAGRVADVDVLLSLDDARRLLPPLGIEVRPGAAHPIFQSDVFGTWTGQPLPVEFMAGFCHRSGDRWLPVAPRTRQAVAIGAVHVFVPDHAELGDMLRRFGRPKDLVRADRLAALLR